MTINVCETSFQDADSGDDAVEISPAKRRKLSTDTFSEDPQPATIFQAPSRVRRRKSPTTPSSAYIRKPTILNAKVVDSETSFASLGTAPWLLAALSALSVLRPTSIQKACIPAILQGLDVIGGSPTGTGKTIAFVAPILQRWAEDPVGIFALILTPTRELALQILEQFKAIASAQSLKTVLIVGGEDMRAQALAMASRPHVVIATPGRLADHIASSGQDTVIGLRRTKIVVLDEADRLLASGQGSMLPDVDTCLGALPASPERQTCLFTATITPEVKALKAAPRRENQSSIFLCEVDAEKLAVPTQLKQTYLQVPPSYREAYLHVLLQTSGNLALKSVIVFCNRTSSADLIERLLRNLDHKVTSLHSKLTQRDRVDNLARFRAGAARILVASDVASRGLDIPLVDLVVNFDVPRNPDDYIHRVGRTARAGKTGEAITLIGPRDVALFLAIEERVGTKMEEWSEDRVNVETRVVRDGLKQVGEVKRRVELDIEEGRDILSRRRRGRMKKLQ